MRLVFVREQVLVLEGVWSVGDVRAVVGAVAHVCPESDWIFGSEELVLLYGLDGNPQGRVCL